MALIRLSGSLTLPGENRIDRELILNTAHVMFATPGNAPDNADSIVHMVDTEVLHINMSFENLWELIQRET